MTKPSAEQLAREAMQIEELRLLADDDNEHLFMSGILRGLEWAQGIGTSPSDWIIAIRRVNRVH